MLWQVENYTLKKSLRAVQGGALPWVHVLVITLRLEVSVPMRGT